MNTLELIERMENIALRIWRRNKPYEIQEKMLSIWDDIGEQRDTKYEPLCRVELGEKVTCVIAGSGSYSTGREELLRAKNLRDKLGWSPIEYLAVITNRKESNAGKVAEEYNKMVPKERKIFYIEMDYSNWKRENGITGSTALFGFKPNEVPSGKELEERFRITKNFDSTLKGLTIEKLGEFPNFISFRGWNRLTTDGYVTLGSRTKIDNTHPATLVIREEDGKPRYAGWQENAYNKMREDGLDIFPASLICVDPLRSCNDLGKVDAGELLAMSPGNPGNYEKTEDYFLLVLKETGLLPFFWGLSKEEKLVKYITKDGQLVEIKQREVVVANLVMSGLKAFGQNEDDWRILSDFGSVSRTTS